MNVTTDLQHEIRLVIENLERRPWTQGGYQDGDAVCAHGAVMTCQGLRPGDEHIIRAVMRAKGLTEQWNDTDGRTKSEVLQKFAEISGISDADLELTFGPNWRLVIAVIRRAAVLTLDEAQRMDAARDAVRAAAWAAVRARAAARDAVRAAAWARDAAWAAARDAARDAVRDAVRAAAWARDAAWAAARDAAWDAVRAAVVADLVGQHGLTQQHIDLLMKPWIDVLGTNWAQEMVEIF